MKLSLCIQLVFLFWFLCVEIRTSPMAAISDVFETGSYDITSITVTTSHASKPPVKLFIIAPKTNGTYPVLLFCHGFYLTNTWYSNLLQHIASHGYIVVAPMFYRLLIISNQEEVNKAAQVTEWISSTTGLHSVLPNNVNRDDEKLALSGHSRGGKTAFTLALAMKNTPSKFKALIGVDPVAGSSTSMQLAPKILQYIPRIFDMSIPVAVIGTEFGNQRLGLIPQFAPDGVNHSEFFNESKPPVFYLLANGYGHCDILDDWIAGYLSYICKSGKGSKELMRKGVGGVVVAFLRAYLGGGEEVEDLNDIVNDPSIAPITFDPAIYIRK